MLKNLKEYFNFDNKENNKDIKEDKDEIYEFYNLYLLKKINDNKYKFTDKELHEFKNIILKKEYILDKFSMIQKLFLNFEKYTNLKIDISKFDKINKLWERKITIDELKLIKIQDKFFNKYKSINIISNNTFDILWEKSQFLIKITQKIRNSIALTKIKVISYQDVYNYILKKQHLLSYYSYLIILKKRFYPISLLLKKNYSIKKFYDTYKAIVCSIVFLKTNYKNGSKIILVKSLFFNLIKKLNYIKTNTAQAIYYELKNYKENNIHYNEKDLKIIIYNLYKIELFIKDLFKKKYYSYLENDVEIINFIILNIEDEYKDFLNHDLYKLINNITLYIQNKYDNRLK